jgi:hypothetical protein
MRPHLAQEQVNLISHCKSWQCLFIAPPLVASHDD